MVIEMGIANSQHHFYVCACTGLEEKKSTSSGVTPFTPTSQPHERGYIETIKHS